MILKSANNKVFLRPSNSTLNTTHMNKVISPAKTVMVLALFICTLFLGETQAQTTTLLSDGFESATPAWTFNGAGSSIGRANNNARTGTWSAAFIGGTGSSRIDASVITPTTITFTPGYTYRVTAWVKSNATSSGPLFKIAKVLTADNASVTAATGVNQLYAPANINSTSYTQIITATFSVSISENRYIGFQAVAASGGPGNNTNLWIDDILIEQICPALSASAGPNQNSLCGTSTAMAATTPTVGTGTWSVVSGSGSFTSPNSPTSAVTGIGLGANLYRWTVSFGACNTATSDVTITRLQSPAISTPPTAQIACAGSSASFTVSATGAGLTYQWRKGGTPLSNGGNISGATSATLVINPTSASDAASYDVVVSGTCTPSVTSSAASLTVNALPAITVQPTNKIICEGAPTSFSVTATGTAITYQWRKGGTPIANGGNISGATSNTLSINPASLADAGNYDVVVSGTCTPPATSTAASLTVNALPTTPSITPSGPTTFCSGGSVTITSSASTSYLWSTGATTQAINVTSTGSYSVTITNANGCTAVSAPTGVTVNTNPATPTITPSGSTTFCAGGSVTLTSSAATGYLWSTGATSQNIIVTTSGSYVVTVSNANGCTAASAPTAVTVNPLPSAPTITPSGSTTFCSGGSVTLTSSSGTSYAWSTGATTQAINATTSGNYIVTITNANGCTASSSPTAVVVNPLPGTPTITPSGATTFCTGGSVTLTSTAATAYQWSTGATTQDIVVSTTGNYIVTISDANGCTASSAAQNVTVNLLPNTTITPSGPTSFCDGGSVTLTASPTGTYVWSTTESTQQIIVTANGSYSVTVTDGNGCSATYSSIAITVYTLPATPTITPSGATTFCDGGSVTLTSSAAAGYLWSNGATTQAINAIFAGNYSVTITDANGCTSVSAPETVTVNPLPTVIPANNGPLCAGDNLNLSATTSGSGGLSHSWTGPNGFTASQKNVPPFTIGAAGAGYYVLTVTDGNGCVNSDSTLVIVNAPSASIMVSGPTTFCDGGSVLLTANAAATYNWSSGETTQAISATISGNYLVTITDVNGCTATSAGVLVTVNPAPTTPTITPSGPTTFCDGGSVTLSASTATSFLWSNGATGQDIIVSTSGNFTVTINDANGCTASSLQEIVTVNPLPNSTITPSGVTTFCDGGSVTLTASPTSTYLWSNSETTQQIVVSTTGNYSVTVTDGNGCVSASPSTNVTVNPLPSAPTITPSGATTFCDGGSVTLTSSAATSYLWSNSETTQAIIVTSGGLYSVTITDVNGCTATSNPELVSVNSLPNSAITPSGTTTFCVGGSVTLTASPAGTYLWSNSETTQQIVVSTSGSYTVTVTDGNGCSSASAAEPVTVNPLPNTTITPSGATAFCDGGSVTLTASPAGTYLWSNSETTQQIIVTASGNYVVTVTDANGCVSASAAEVVTVYPTPITPTITPSGPTTFCDGGSVTLSASAANSYLWSNGATVQDILVSTSGNFTVTITDANGCTASSLQENVTVNPLPNSTITPSGATTFCDGGSVTLTASPAGTYLWSNSETTQQIVVTATGNYSVTVTDGNGCASASTSVGVTVNPLPSAPTITPSGATTFCAGSSVTLTSSAAAAYMWSTGATTQAIVVSATGSYSVTISDGNGCQATSTATSVTVNPLPTATITPSGATTFCNGGSVTLTANASIGYLWSTTETTQDITVSTSGNYVVTVTDANGCSSASAPTVVTVNPLVGAPSAPAGATTLCQAAGPTAYTTSATNANSYVWSVTGAGNSVSGTSITGTVTWAAGFTGSATISVYAVNGCGNSTPVNTIVSVTPTVGTPSAPSGTTTRCIGAGNDVYTTSTTNATSYTWSVTGAGNSIAGTGTSGTVTWAPGFSGSATVSVQANGCNGPSAQVNTVVTVTPLPSAAGAISGTNTTCQQQSQVYTVPAIANATGYNWNLPAGYSIIAGANTNTVTIEFSTTAATGNISVNGTNSCGSGTVSANFAITVNAVTLNAVITNSPVCQGTSINLTGTVTSGAASNFSWTGPNGFSAPNTKSPTIGNAQSVNAGVYTLLYTAANGCVSTNNATVVVSPLPFAAGAISGTTPVCQGQSGVAFSIGAVTNATGYNWTLPTGATIAAGANTNSITVNFATNAISGNVTVAGTNSCGSGTSSSFALVVNPLPVAAGVISGSNSVCQGQTGVVYTVPAIANATGYNWTLPSGASITAGANTSSITVSYSGSAVSGNVSVFGTNACGNGTSSISAITVSTPPTTAIAGPAQNICAVFNTTLAANTPTSGTGMWNVVNGTGVFGNASSPNSTVSGLSSGVNTFSWTISNGACLPSTDNVVITVNALPSSAITPGGPTTFCAGGSVILTAASNTQYQWSTSETTQQITASTSGNYIVTVTDGNGCTSSSSISVTSTPLVTPFVSITASQNPVCDSITVVFTASPVNGGTIPSYQWKVNGNNVGPDSVAYLVKGLVTGDQVTVVMTSTADCPSPSTATSNIITMTVNPLVPSCIPPTGLVTNSCGKILTAITDFVYADSVPDATKYQYRVSNTTLGFSKEFIRDAATTCCPKSFALNMITGVKFNTTYNLEVRAFISGVWGNYSAICQVTTPPFPIISLNPNSCNITLGTINQTLYCQTIYGVTNFQYQVTGPNGYNSIYTRNSGSNTFFMSWLSPAVQYNTTYNVSVRAFSNGDWGTFGPACTITTPVFVATTQLTSGSCGSILTDLTTQLYANPVANATNYEFEITRTGFSTVYATNSSSNNFNMSSVTGIKYNLVYNVRVRANVSGTWGPYGAICTVTTPINVPTTQLATVNCNTTMATYTSEVNCVAVLNATNYEYRVTNTTLGYSELYQRLSGATNFSLSWMPNISYNTSYNVEVRAYANDTWGTFGSVCALMTPINVPNTSMTTNSCNVTVSNLAVVLFCDPVSGASDYQYEIISTGFNTLYNRGSSSNSFSLQWVPGIQNGKTYTIRVRANINGFWGNFSSSCTVTTPSVTPMTQLSSSFCNTTLPTLSQTLYCDLVYNATNYEYNVVNVGLGYNQTYNRQSSSTSFNLTWMNGILYNTTYTVTARAFVNGAWGPFGTACTVTTPSNIPSTSLRPNSCGITLTSLHQTLYINPVSGAGNYEFLVTSPGFSANYLRNSTSSTFALGWVPGIQYNTVYAVQVRAQVGGVWGTFGPSCNLTTPIPPAKITVANWVGTNDSDQRFEVSIYPNPAVDIVNVELPNVLINSKTEMHAQLHSIDGRHIKTLEVKANASIIQFDISDWESGIYMLIIDANGKRSISKIVKQ